MDNTREQLLNQIHAFSQDMTEQRRLLGELSKVKAQNAKLQEELVNAPTEQSTFVREAQEDLTEEAKRLDGAKNSKINKFFMTLTVALAAVNMVLLFLMADKTAVPERMEMVNMELFGNVTAEQLTGMFPLLVILAIVFQIAAIIVAKCIAEINIGKR